MDQWDAVHGPETAFWEAIALFWGIVGYSETGDACIDVKSPKPNPWRISHEGGQAMEICPGSLLRKRSLSAWNSILIDKTGGLR